MSALNYPSIKYQAEGKLMELAVDIAESTNLKKVKSKINKATRIQYYLDALAAAESSYLTPKQKSQIYQCLTSISEITDFPTAPSVDASTIPSILIGPPGPQGPAGATGADGENPEGAIVYADSSQPILQYKILSIGAWDMDTSASTTVSLSGAGISPEDIRMIDIQVLSDSGDALPFLFNDTGPTSPVRTSYTYSSTTLTLLRYDDSPFNGPGYDDDSMNRGFVTIFYLA